MKILKSGIKVGLSTPTASKPAPLVARMSVAAGAAGMVLAAVSADALVTKTTMPLHISDPGKIVWTTMIDEVGTHLNELGESLANDDAFIARVQAAGLTSMVRHVFFTRASCAINYYEDACTALDVKKYALPGEELAVQPKGTNTPLTAPKPTTGPGGKAAPAPGANSVEDQVFAVIQELCSEDDEDPTTTQKNVARQLKKAGLTVSGTDLPGILDNLVNSGRIIVDENEDISIAPVSEETPDEDEDEEETPAVEPEADDDDEEEEEAADDDEEAPAEDEPDEEGDGMLPGEHPDDEVHEADDAHLADKRKNPVHSAFHAEEDADADAIDVDHDHFDPTSEDDLSADVAHPDLEEVPGHLNGAQAAIFRILHGAGGVRAARSAMSKAIAGVLKKPVRIVGGVYNADGTEMRPQANRLSVELGNVLSRADFVPPAVAAREAARADKTRMPQYAAKFVNFAIMADDSPVSLTKKQKEDVKKALKGLKWFSPGLDSKGHTQADWVVFPARNQQGLRIPQLKAYVEFFPNQNIDGQFEIQAHFNISFGKTTGSECVDGVRSEVDAEKWTLDAAGKRPNPKIMLAVSKWALTIARTGRMPIPDAPKAIVAPSRRGRATPVTPAVQAPKPGKK